jgi:xanthine dehydrogenase YagS FAD-binding subunit
MKSFELFRPDSLEAAAGAAGAGTAFKAGGLDLVDRLKERVEAPETVIDLLPLRAQMSAIEVQGGHVDLGALATLTQIAEAPVLQPAAYRAVTAAAAHAATPQIRNRATVGGNLLQMARCWYLRNARFACTHSGRGDTCLAMEGEHRYHAIMGTFDCIRVHPSNLAPPLLAMGATAVVRGADGTLREQPLRELYPADPTAEDPEHTLQAGEILVAVRIPVAAGGTTSAYRESREQQAHDWATTAAAVRLQIRGGRIADAAVCLGAVAPNPVVADAAAARLKGEVPGRALFEEVAEIAYADADPLDQNAYKVPVGKAVLIDALTEAAGTR